MRLLLRENGLKILKYNKKKFIYLISPIKIYNSFFSDLIKVLKAKKNKFFSIKTQKKTLEKNLIIGKK